MKGTAPRGASAEEDDARATELQNDEKNRAEHVMIVDLLRNDLNRICSIGSVQASTLFNVERLPTLFQMTSTVRGELREGASWYEVFQALFPGGSITGAPKRHTTKLIQQIEREPRGVYTGAIGYIAPDRSACFNIAIRTAVLKDDTLRMGIGGGIVHDSTADGEYNECLLKSAFLLRASKPFHLLETMRWNNGFPLLQRHLQRLQHSAQALGFACDLITVQHQLQTASLQWSNTTKRVRLLLARDGQCTIEAVDLTPWRQPLQLRLSTITAASNSPHLRHKTTFRPAYAPEYEATSAAGFDDALFLNERGELTESCIATLLIKFHGQWLTPQLGSGVLPGVYRSALLEHGLVQTEVITLQHLRDASHICLCNAVRGVGNVASLQLPGGEQLHWPASEDAPHLPSW